MLIGGIAWIVFISLISALVQNLAPEWVRARVLAIYLLVFREARPLEVQHGVRLHRAGIRTALVYAGFGAIVTEYMQTLLGAENGALDNRHQLGRYTSTSQPSPSAITWFDSRGTIPGGH